MLNGESLFNKEYNLLQQGNLQKYLRIELGTWVEKKKCTAFSCAFLFLGPPISLQKKSKKQVRCKWCDLKIQNK